MLVWSVRGYRPTHCNIKIGYFCNILKISDILLIILDISRCESKIYYYIVNWFNYINIKFVFGKEINLEVDLRYWFVFAKVMMMKNNII